MWVTRATFTRYTSEVVDLAGLPPFFPAGSGFGARPYADRGRQADHADRRLRAENGERSAGQVQLGNSAPDFRVGWVNDVLRPRPRQRGSRLAAGR